MIFFLNVRVLARKFRIIVKITGGFVFIILHQDGNNPLNIIKYPYTHHGFVVHRKNFPVLTLNTIFAVAVMKFRQR
jgi:adenosine/AMP kinase